MTTPADPDAMPLGTQAEEMIYRLLGEIFGPLFVWQNPVLARSNKSRELTDVLAVFGETGYCFESKAIAGDWSEDLEEKVFSRIKKAVDKARSQLTGALRALKNPRLGTVYSQTKHQLKLLEAVQRWRALIIIYLPDKDVFSGPTLQLYSDSSLTVHYLSIQDLKQCLRLFDTPSDLEGFLSFRERFYSIKSVLRPREVDLIAFYAIARYFYDDCEKKVDEFLTNYARAAQSGSICIVDFAESLYVDRKRQLDEAIEERMRYRIVDFLIERVGNSPLTVAANTPLAKQFIKNIPQPNDEDSKTLISEALCRLDRRTRVYIGRTLERSMEMAQVHQNAYFALNNGSEPTWFFFWGDSLTPENELIFQMATFNAKYGMKAEAVCGIGFFGLNFDESQYRIFSFKVPWKHDAFFQNAWDQGWFLRPGDATGTGFRGLAVGKHGEFLGPSVSSNRSAKRSSLLQNLLRKVYR